MLEIRLRLPEDARDRLGRVAVRERRTPAAQAEVMLLGALGLRPSADAADGESVTGRTPRSRNEREVK